MLNEKNRSQFNLQPVEGSSTLFTNNHTNPQLVRIKGSTMTFQHGNIYKLSDPDLSYFITNAQLDGEPQNEDLIYTFLNDMKYIINIPGVKKRRDIISLKI